MTRSAEPRPLRGTTSVPGDKSITHRALLLGALADGPVDVANPATGRDVAATIRCLRELGVAIEEPAGGLRVHGVGLHGLRAPRAPLDCGNAATTMRLLLGLLAGQPFEARLTGDASLRARPMERVLEPLRRMGLEVLDGPAPPLRIRGRRPLRGLSWSPAVASAQVKSALQLAGLWAEAPVTVHEPGPSRDHTERLLAHLGEPPRSGRVAVPGDPSSAAFPLAAATLVPGSRVTVRDVGTNATRTGFLDAAEAMGARVERGRTRHAGGEPHADVSASHGPLRGTVVEGTLTVRTLDELPLLAVLAACAEGPTELRDAGELRVKESDRIATTARMLEAFGIPAAERRDGLRIEGRPEGPPQPGRVDAAGDHRIAMAASLLARRAPPGSRILDREAAAVSFPEFEATLGALEAG